MTVLHLSSDVSSDLPIDIVEQFVTGQGWHFRRVEDDEMAAEFRGKWCDYSLHFCWSQELSAFHFTCAFDIKIPVHKESEVSALLSLVNDRLWLGHFLIWQDEGIPMYRYSMPLRGSGISYEQIEDLMQTALAECEKYYPTFQYVVWGDKKPRDAVEAAISDPIGEA